MSDKPTSLDFLQAVYLNETSPLPVRLRGAVEAAPYEHPKLTAVSVGFRDGNTFADRLDRAVDASKKVPLELKYGGCVGERT